MIINKNKLKENYVYITFVIYVFSILINITSVFRINDTLQMIIKVIRYLCYAICFIKICADWKNGAHITKTMIFTIILASAIALFSKHYNIFLILIILFSLRDIDVNKLIKMVCVTYFVGYFLVVCFSLLGIFPNWEYSRGEAKRYSLGFFFPTDTMSIFLSIVLMYCYLNKSQVSLLNLIMLETINVFLYKYTDGRLGFLLTSFVIIVTAITKISKVRSMKESKVFNSLVYLICNTFPMVLFVLVSVFTCLYSVNNSLATELNEVLNNRLLYSEKAFEEHQLTLFGEDIEWNGYGGYGYTKEKTQDYDYNFVDCSYFRLLLDYGIIFTIVILLAYTEALINCGRQKKYWDIFAICIVLISAVIEHHLIDIGLNIFLVLCIPLLDIGNIECLDYENIKKLLVNKKNKSN